MTTPQKDGAGNNPRPIEGRLAGSLSETGGDVIQVQHSSDFNHDGVWHDLEVVPADWQGNREWTRADFIRSRCGTFRRAYGRPVRVAALTEA